MTKFEAQLMIYSLILISFVLSGCYSWKRSIESHHRHSKDCKKEGNKKLETIMVPKPKATAKMTTMSLLNTTFSNNISMLDCNAPKLSANGVPLIGILIDKISYKELVSKLQPDKENYDMTAYSGRPFEGICNCDDAKFAPLKYGFMKVWYPSQDLKPNDNNDATPIGIRYFGNNRAFAITCAAIPRSPEETTTFYSMGYFSVLTEDGQVWRFDRYPNMRYAANTTPAAVPNLNERDKGVYASFFPYCDSAKECHMYMVLLQKPKFSDGQVLTMYSNEGNVWVSPPGFYESELGPESKYLKVIGASCQNTWDIIGWNLKYYNIPKNMSTECMGKRFVHRAEIIAATK